MAEVFNGSRAQYALSVAIMEAGGEHGLIDEIRARVMALNNQELARHSRRAEEAHREASNFSETSIEIAPFREVNIVVPVVSGHR